MDKFLGMPIWQNTKKMTDAEYVERTRKNLRLAKKLIWLHVIVLALLGGALWGFAKVILQMYQGFAPEETPQKMETGLALGFLFGLFLSMLAFRFMETVIFIFDLLDLNRTPRLLVKYYDMVQKYAPKQLEFEERTASSRQQT